MINTFSAGSQDLALAESLSPLQGLRQINRKPPIPDLIFSLGNYLLLTGMVFLYLCNKKVDYGYRKRG